MLTNTENHILVLHSIKNNCWEIDEKGIEFRGRPASSLEKKEFNVQNGVRADQNSIYIYSSNLPEDIKPDDKVVYLGKEWIVESVGYYLDQNRIVDASIFDESYIKENSPKGITLK